MLDQRELILRKEIGAKVVQHDSVVPVQLLGGAREAGAQLLVVDRAEAHEHRFVVALGGVLVGMLKALEQLVGRVLAAAAEGKLGLLAGDAHQADQFQLVVARERGARI